MILFDNFKKAIGKVLRKIREDKKEVDKERYKQSSVADIINSSSGYLSDIERGVQYPSLFQLKKIIVNGLECDLDSVLNEIASEYLNLEKKGE